MKKMIIALAVAAPLAFASVGSAAPAAKTTKIKTKKASACAKAKAKGKACNIEFKTHDVKGDRPGATGSSIMAKLEARFGGLIKFRKHFDDKVLKAADGI